MVQGFLQYKANPDDTFDQNRSGLTISTEWIIRK